MSTPELPQPIYPGSPGASPGPAPAAPGPRPDAAGGPPANGYGPIVPGAPGGGPGAPRGGASGLGRWILLGGAALAVVVAVVVLVVSLVRPAAPGPGPGAASSPTPEGTAETANTTTESGTGSDPDPELADSVAGLWAGGATTAEQGCVLEQASADGDLAAAITDFYYEGSLSSREAALLAGVNVDCLNVDSLEAVLLDAPITPTCQWYDFSSLTDSDWRTLLSDAYITMAGLVTREEFAEVYFPSCYFED